jgi:hypothetical protein
MMMRCDTTGCCLLFSEFSIEVNVASVSASSPYGTHFFLFNCNEK